MSTVAWLLVGYVALDRILTVAWIGRTWKITHGGAVLALITGALIVWGIVSLAGGCS
jgi:hypothetical protein